MAFTSSKSRYFIQAFSYSLIPLDTSLLASARAFSAFFALANADLWDFSAVVFAAMATTQAFLEALSSASRDEMHALAAAKSSAAQEGERKLNK
jgi:hypothetical protein